MSLPPSHVAEPGSPSTSSPGGESPLHFLSAGPATGPTGISLSGQCIALALRRTRWSETALRVSRWTYSILFPLSLLYFPLKAGGVRPVECEWTFSASLAVYSLGNIQHLAGFAIFFVLSVAQLPNAKHAISWSFLACFTMGLLVEIAEGATGIHHCRMRDLIPDMAGACIGAMAVLLVRRIAALRAPAGNAA